MEGSWLTMFVNQLVSYNYVKLSQKLFICSCMAQTPFPLDVHNISQKAFMTYFMCVILYVHN